MKLSKKICQFFLATLVLPSNSWGQIQFPAEKNNLTPLAQKFEFQFIEDEILVLGNDAINPLNFTLEIQKTPAQKDNFIISWPSSIFSSGELQIKNNIGKLIWSQTIESIKATPQILQNPSGFKEEISKSFVRQISPDDFEVISHLPFFKLCASKINKKSRALFCTPDLYIKKEDSNYFVKPRNTATTEAAQVTINGKNIGNQGIIVLNSSDENLYFTAISKTGAIFEFETLKRDVLFKDVTQGKKTEELNLIFSGTEPLMESRFKKISTGTYLVTLEKEKPSLFLKGEVDIPMKQEFSLKGSLPLPEDRPQLLQKAKTVTYSSEIELLLKPSPKTTLSNYDENSEVIPTENGTLWKLKNLENQKNNTRYLKIKKGTDEFVGSYNVSKFSSFSFGVIADFALPTQLSTKLYSEKWFENFIGLNSNLTNYRWGLHASLDKSLYNSSSSISHQNIEIQLLHRLIPDYLSLNNQWIFGTSFQSIQFSDKNAAISGTALGLHISNISPLSYLENSNQKIFGNILLPMSSTDSALGTSIAAGYSVLSTPSLETAQSEFGVKLQKYTVLGSPSWTNQLHIFYGLKWDL